MKTSEILATLRGLTIHEHTPEETLRAMQLAKDLYTAIRALENIKGHQELAIKGDVNLSNIWRIADKALKEIS